MTMETKVLLIIAVIIATTAAVAIAPLASQIAAADKPDNPGSQGDKTTTQEVCTHNGNGRSVDCDSDEADRGNSVQSDEITCTTHGNRVDCS